MLFRSDSIGEHVEFEWTVDLSCSVKTEVIERVDESVHHDTPRNHLEEVDTCTDTLIGLSVFHTKQKAASYTPLQTFSSALVSIVSESTNLQSENLFTPYSSPVYKLDSPLSTTVLLI